MKKAPFVILAVLLAVSLLAFVAGTRSENESQLARAFTEGQINAILDLLAAFNVNEGAIAEIEQVLLNTGAEDEETDEGAGTSSEEEVGGEELEEVVVSGPPTCTLSANRTQPLHYETFRLSWETTNASSILFDPNTTNTSGVYDLPLPSSELDEDGSSEVLANSVGGHVIRLEVEGEFGADYCTLSVDVLRANATGYYEGKMNGTIFVGTIGVTREVAIDHCNKTVEENPEATIVCTWRGDQIYPEL